MEAIVYIITWFRLIITFIDRDNFCLFQFGWKDTCNPDASVTEMLQELNWETLTTRRKTARLSFMYKLSHNLTDFLVEAHLKPNNERRTRGSHAFKFVVPRAKKDIFFLPTNN